jgi:hypothetical protein
MVLKKRLYFTGYKYQLMYLFRTDDNRKDVILLLRISSILSIIPSIFTICTIHLGHISHVWPCPKTLLEQPHALMNTLPTTQHDGAFSTCT